MKNSLKKISEEEKQSILEQHKIKSNVVNEDFNRLLNSKLGNVKPLVEQTSSTPNFQGFFTCAKNKLGQKLPESCNTKTPSMDLTGEGCLLDLLNMIKNDSKVLEKCATENGISLNLLKMGSINDLAKKFFK